MPLRRWFGVQLLLLLGTFLLSLPALANDLGDRADRYDRDPPTRVARVAELQGQVLWYDAEERQWQPLLRNQTLAEGDRVRVGPEGRLGLRIGAHGLWLDERGELEIRRLDEARIDLDLEQGALALRWLTREVAQDALVRTREGRFSFERAGAYRIDQLRQASRAQAYEGRLRFDHRGADDAPVLLEAPEQVELWWEAGPRAERSRLLRHDAFGDWLSASLGFGRGESFAWRDRPAYRYVSPELNGAEELDAYGRWETSSEFGPLWFPLRVSVDWVPFRQGRWIWARHWGWTWVDDHPWGYATSHYGRWVHWRGRWCWAPGSVVVPRPVFAPALVAWVGHGGGVQVGVQIGGRHAPPVAWVPLAPYESYRPWYRHSPGYLRRIDPDPHTVRRPTAPSGWVGHNRAVPGALSTFSAEAGPSRRAMPVRVEGAAVGSAQAWVPLPQAPTRQWMREAGREPQPVVGEAGPSRGNLPLRSPPEAPRDAAPAAPAVVQPAPMPPAPQSQEPRREVLPWRGERADRAERNDREDRIERSADEPRRVPAPVWRSDRVEPRSEPRPEPRQDRTEDARTVPWRAPSFDPPQGQPRDGARMPEPPVRRIEVPRAEPRAESRAESRPPVQRTEPPRRSGRDDEAGPRRHEAR